MLLDFFPSSHFLFAPCACNCALVRLSAWASARANTHAIFGIFVTFTLFFIESIDVLLIFRNEFFFSTSTLSSLLSVVVVALKTIPKAICKAYCLTWFVRRSKSHHPGFVCRTWRKKCFCLLGFQKRKKILHLLLFIDGIIVYIFPLTQWIPRNFAKIHKAHVNLLSPSLSLYFEFMEEIETET